MTRGVARDRLDWLVDELATVWNEHTCRDRTRAMAMLARASGEWAEAVGACFARFD